MTVFVTTKIDFEKMPEGIWEKQKIDANMVKAIISSRTNNLINLIIEDKAEQISDELFIPIEWLEHQINDYSDFNSGDKILVYNGDYQYTSYSYHKNIGDTLQAKLDYLENFCNSLNQRCY